MAATGLTACVNPGTCAEERRSCPTNLRLAGGRPLSTPYRLHAPQAPFGRSGRSPFESEVGERGCPGVVF